MEPGRIEHTGLDGLLDALKRPEQTTVRQQYGRLPGTEILSPRAPAHITVRENRRRRLLSSFPLWCVLAVQAGLSARLIWSNTAFTDEALYLWAGHLEWQHWLRGLPLPGFPTYFSGSPTVYPPVGAIADSLGGLAGARLLSLCFMLTASVLLYGMAGQLFGRRSGLFASAVFASTASAQFLGAFATYDAMSLMLLALAARLAVATGTAQGAARLTLLLGTGAVMALADAAKYAAALWNPIVIALAALAIWHANGWRRGAAAGVICGGSFAVVAAAMVWLAGYPYRRGISLTTLSRQQGTSSPYGIIVDSLGWVGVVAALAVIGAVTVTVTRTSLPLRITAWVLTGAVVLAPANQARIHVFTSLFKHVGFGAWFGAAVAGVALAALADAVPRVKRTAALRAAVSAALVSALLGTLLAATHFTTWAPSAAFVAAVKPVVPGRGPVLAADNGNVIEYYLRQESSKAIFYGPWYFRYRDPDSHRHLVGTSAFADAIRHRFFRVIALSFSDSKAIDLRISGDIRRYGGYRLMKVVPYQVAGWRSAYRIWVREGSAR
jgi:Dolichyl-phosphate-mannose-protein mannosyltransferase